MIFRIFGKASMFSYCVRTHNFSILSRHLWSVDFIQEKSRYQCSSPVFLEILNRCFRIYSIVNKKLYCFWHAFRILTRILAPFSNWKRICSYFLISVPLLQLKARLRNSLQHRRFRVLEKRYRLESRSLAEYIILLSLSGNNSLRNSPFPLSRVHE